MLTLKQACLIATGVYSLFAIANVISKWLLQTYSPWQIQFTISVFMLVMLGAYQIYKHGLKKAFYTQHIKWHAARGFLLSGNLVLLLYAISRIPLADVYALTFLNPIWLALLSIIFFKEHVPLARWVSIIVGFIGVAIIAGPHYTHFDIGMLAALGAGLFFALSALIIRRIGKDEPVPLFTIATSICMLIITAPMLPGNVIMPDLEGWALMGISSIISMVGILGIVYVFSRFTKQYLVSPMQYTQLIWGAALAWVLFDEVPGINVYIGSVLIIGAGIAIIRSGKGANG